MSGSGPVKNQHYVPQAYLRGFAAAAERGEDQVSVLDKKDGRIFVSNIRNVAAERFFYDGPGDQETERALAELEAAAAPILQRLASTGTVEPLSPMESRILADFVAVLDARTGSFRAAVVDLLKQHDQYLEQVAQRLGARHENAAPSTGEEERAMHKTLMWSMAGRTRKSVTELQWVRLIAESGARFVTSDHPVVKFNPRDPPAPWLGNLGWKSRGIQVFLPISPEVCICIGDFEQTMAGGYRYSDDGVRFVNGLQASHARRFLFSANERELRMIESLLLSRPELRDTKFEFEVTFPPLREEE